MAFDVHAHALDQRRERVEREREARARVGERFDHGIALGRGAAGERGERGVERVQPRELLIVGQLAVADVVDAASERVDRAHRAAAFA